MNGVIALFKLKLLSPFCGANELVSVKFNGMEPENSEPGNDITLIPYPLGFAAIVLILSSKRLYKYVFVVEIEVAADIGNTFLIYLVFDGSNENS